MSKERGCPGWLLPHAQPLLSPVGYTRGEEDVEHGMHRVTRSQPQEQSNAVCASLVIPRYSHHALEQTPRPRHDVFLYGNGEHCLSERAIHRLEVDHLHVGAVQAATDAAIGSDKLTIGVALLHLVDNA